MGRFGGWQAQWLASVIMMTGESSGTDNGMRYARQIERKNLGGRGGKYDTVTAVTAEIYTIGIVDIDEAWLIALIPEINRRDKFLQGDQNGFYAE